MAQCLVTGGMVSLSQPPIPPSLVSALYNFRGRVVLQDTRFQHLTLSTSQTDLGSVFTSVVLHSETGAGGWDARSHTKCQSTLCCFTKAKQKVFERFDLNGIRQNVCCLGEKPLNAPCWALVSGQMQGAACSPTKRASWALEMWRESDSSGHVFLTWHVNVSQVQSKWK